MAVTLGQAGLLKELINIIDCMKQKPEKLKYMRRKNWDPVLQPDLVVYNAVSNCCPSCCIFSFLMKSSVFTSGFQFLFYV